MLMCLLITPPELLVARPSLGGGILQAAAN